jgi:hypothetical protein
MQHMGTELVFGGGHRVRVVGTNAETLIRTLNRPVSEEIRLPSGQVLAPGWVDIQAEREGAILVNPSQVAYVRDVPDQEPVMETTG